VVGILGQVRVRKAEECGERPGAALPPQGQPAVAGQPRQRAFDDPAVPAESLAAPHTAASDARGDGPPAQPGPQMRIVIALVRVQLHRPASARSTPGADGRDGLHQRDQREAVVGVGRADRHGQRQAGGVGEHVQLGAALAAVNRVEAGQRASLICGGTPGSTGPIFDLLPRREVVSAAAAVKVERPMDERP
jgi:hypothetical protein